MRFTTMALCSLLGLLTLAACSGGGTSPLPSITTVSNTASRKPTDLYGATGSVLKIAVPGATGVSPLVDPTLIDGGGL